jgi:hypothetical protein
VWVWSVQQCKGRRSRSRATAKSFPEKAAPFENPGAHECVTWRQLDTSNQELSPLQSKTQAVLDKTCFRRCETDSRRTAISNPLSRPLFDKLTEIAAERLMGLPDLEREIRTRNLRSHGRRALACGRNLAGVCYRS